MIEPLAFKVANHGTIHPIPTTIGGVEAEGAPQLKSYTVGNPWAGAYTKTFMYGDSMALQEDLGGGNTKPYSLVGKLAAEFVGTLLFIFIGSLSALKSTEANATTHAAFAHGLTIFVLVASLGHISGGHFNPAVSFAVSLAGKMNPLLVIPYWLAQLGGGFVGALLVKAVTAPYQYESIIGGATILPKNEEWYQGLIVEAVLTLILAQTVLCCAVDTDDNLLAPLAIGLTVALDVFGAGSISGASMNPARSFGPCVAAALFSDMRDKSSIWTTHYVYWAGPLAGAALGALLYRVFWSRSYNRLLP